MTTITPQTSRHRFTAPMGEPFTVPAFDDEDEAEKREDDEVSRSPPTAPTAPTPPHGPLGPFPRGI